MLKSHRNLLEPRPSDRLRIGERVVDIPLRAIAPEAGGEGMRVTLKSLGVLLSLVAHAGKPVSREALLEWVWPDTLPTDDVITQAITQLRKALGDDREHPRYIETISKQGYRLIAPVEWIVDAGDAAGGTAGGIDPASVASPASTSPDAVGDAPDAVVHAGGSAAVPAPRGVGGLRAAIVAAGLVLLVATGVFVWRQRASSPSPAAADGPAAQAAVLAPLTRIASAPEREVAPSLSPDGAQVVYARSRRDLQSAALFVQTTSAVPPRALTEFVDLRWDNDPVWSPNGREIVFMRSGMDSCALMIIPATGGATRELGPCLDDGMPVGWYPDGRHLIGSGRLDTPSGKSAGTALYRMALDRGVWEPIAYERLDEDVDLWPRVSPDGRWIAFQRNLSLGDLWRIPVSGGRPERLTSLRTNFNGLGWTPDSRSVVFSRLRSDGVVLGKLDIATRTTVEYRSQEGALIAPSLAIAQDQVAFAIEDAKSQLRDLALADGREAFTRAQLRFASSRSDQLPSYSPDGSQVLFVSDRDGERRLWWSERTRPETLRPIEGLYPMPRFPAVWHADSRRALVIGDSLDGTKTAYEIEPMSGRVRRLDVPDRVPVLVSYHPDPGRILVVAEREQGRLGLMLYDRTRTPWRMLARIEDVVLAMRDPLRPRIVFVRTYKPGIWEADLALGGAREIDTVQFRPRIRTLTPAQDGLWVMDSRPDCEWFWRPVAGGAPGRSGLCLGDGAYMPFGVAYDARQRTLLASVPDNSGMDIGLLPLSAFRAVTPVAGDAP